MSEEPKIETLDVAEIDRWLNDAQAPIEELIAQFPFLRTEAQARRFLEDIREGLASVERGEVFTTEEVIQELEARRRARRSAAE